MSMKTTDKGIKKFSKEEKLAILDEGKIFDSSQQSFKIPKLCN